MLWVEIPAYNVCNLFIFYFSESVHLHLQNLRMTQPAIIVVQDEILSRITYEFQLDKHYNNEGYRIIQNGIYEIVTTLNTSESLVAASEPGITTEGNEPPRTVSHESKVINSIRHAIHQGTVVTRGTAWKK